MALITKPYEYKVYNPPLFIADGFCAGYADYYYLEALLRYGNMKQNY